MDRFYITAGGEVLPCEFLQISFGNVLEESFEVIFERMRREFDVPCIRWLCCTQREAVVEIMKKNDLKSTPLAWQYTQELIKGPSWAKGEPTPLYTKLGIYES